ALPARPGFVARFLVSLVRVRRVFACAHESVARSVVGDRVISLARLFHEILALRDRSVDTRIISSVEAVNRAVDFVDRVLCVRTSPVKHESGSKLLAVRRKTKPLTPTPTEAGDRHLPVTRGQL